MDFFYAIGDIAILIDNVWDVGSSVGVYPVTKWVNCILYVDFIRGSKTYHH